MNTEVEVKLPADVTIRNNINDDDVNVAPSFPTVAVIKLR